MGNIKDELLDRIKITDLEWLSSTEASITITIEDEEDDN